jgi:hypothetical protein
MYCILWLITYLGFAFKLITVHVFHLYISLVLSYYIVSFEIKSIGLCYRYL